MELSWIEYNCTPLKVTLHHMGWVGFNTPVLSSIFMKILISILYDANSYMVSYIIKF